MRLSSRFDRSVVYKFIIKFLRFEKTYMYPFISAHFPGYNFCGPGTKFLERISRGQLGVNKLDEACRLHDSVYTHSTDLRMRMDADKLLELQAWERVKAKDSSYREKVAAWMVSNVMKVKRKWNTRRLKAESRKGRKKSYMRHWNR